MLSVGPQPPHALPDAPGSWTFKSGAKGVVGLAAKAGSAVNRMIKARADLRREEGLI